MRILKINCMVLMIEGVAAIALFMYWELTLPADAVCRWFGWSFTREGFLGILETIGICSCVIGAAGWLAVDGVVRWRQRRQQGD